MSFIEGFILGIIVCVVVFGIIKHMRTFERVRDRFIKEGEIELDLYPKMIEWHKNVCAYDFLYSTHNVWRKVEVEQDISNGKLRVRRIE
jgi:hypothetical protein